ncbi:leucine-rich repeat domain-containing protein [Neochlamydia sp. TUME1]|uniref:leucine-rich repeat domain-containing protein n=1 Tax=Neochlamydia sp. TUME1 TaxID=1478174 RepID=UPI000A4EC3C2|nr:leucine-rich repeat domain-containing protein [Neochlamydia sp. TUME1]
MNPSSSLTIEHLPNEILTPILKACAAPSLYSVCTKWRHLLATEVMPSLYKQIGKMHVPHDDVYKQALIIDRIYKLEEDLSVAEKVNAIFKQIFALASPLSPLDLELKDKPKEKRYITLTNYCSYLVNINRLLMWEKLAGGEEYLGREEIKPLPLKEKGRLFKEWIENHGKDITRLDLRGISLKFLPTEIRCLSQLRMLYLNNNQLTALPGEIGQLSQLQELDLANNQLTTLPIEIGQLSQLQSLNLGGNQLTSLPGEIGQLLQLRELNLYNNQLTTLPIEIGQLLQLRDLNLNNNRLTTLPVEIGQLLQLRELNLNNNQLTNLPAEIGQLSQLQMLNLEYNQLTSLPAQIGQLSQLQWLDLPHNRLTTLPIEIGQLSQELGLDLNGNPLESIPEDIKQRFNL